MSMTAVPAKSKDLGATFSVPGPPPGSSEQPEVSIAARMRPAGLANVIDDFCCFMSSSKKA